MVIRTFKALISKRFCKTLNSYSNDALTLILLMIKTLCLHLFGTQHSIAVLGLLKPWILPPSYQNVPIWGDGLISKVHAGQT